MYIIYDFFLFFVIIQKSFNMYDSGLKKNIIETQNYQKNKHCKKLSYGSSYDFYNNNRIAVYKK